MEKNQLANLFNFTAIHNGVTCIESLRPEDKGTEHQFWFTRQMLAELFGVKSADTITNHVGALLKRGAITDTKNLVSVSIPKARGLKATTLYDLKCFNLLVMKLDMVIAEFAKQAASREE